MKTIAIVGLVVLALMYGASFKGRMSKERELIRMLEDYRDPCVVMGVRNENVCISFRRDVETFKLISRGSKDSFLKIRPLLAAYEDYGLERFLADPTYRLLSDYLAWMDGERRRGRLNTDPYDEANIKRFIDAFY